MQTRQELNATQEELHDTRWVRRWAKLHEMVANVADASWMAQAKRGNNSPPAIQGTAKDEDTGPQAPHSSAGGGQVRPCRTCNTRSTAYVSSSLTQSVHDWKVAESIQQAPVRIFVFVPCRGEIGTRMSEHMIISRELKRAHKCVPGLMTSIGAGYLSVFLEAALQLTVCERETPLPPWC